MARTKEKVAEYSKRYREKHREEIKRRQREAYAANPEKYIEKAKKQVSTNDQIHARHIKWRYGITGEEYARMYEEQKGLCGICFKPETQTKKDGTVYRLSVDHNHTTNKVRGLLCFSCNKKLGHYETTDFTPILAYLEKYDNNG
jgi:Recombination endonuclease VII